MRARHHRKATAEKAIASGSAPSPSVVPRSNREGIFMLPVSVYSKQLNDG